MDIEIRTIVEGELDDWLRSLAASFSESFSSEDNARERSVAEVDRVIAALDDGQIVGGAMAASYRLTVPGGARVRGAGITAVGVQPTHRRRGINAALMRAQLDDVHARGEPIAVLYASEGGIYGRFGTYRVKNEWRDSLPKLELSVRQLVATTPQAYADIWRYLLDIDLIDRVKAWNRPADEALLYLMEEPRRLRFRTSDALRVRLVDVPAALGARGYNGDGRVVFDVEDAFCPWNEGRYALEARAGVATCIRTDDAADIACGARELGATYLGGATFRQLQRAGLVRELRPGGLQRADALFASDPAPWSSFIF